MKKYLLILLIPVLAYAIDRPVTSRDGSVVLDGFTAILNKINGTEKSRVNSTGVGISQTNPKDRLHIGSQTTVGLGSAGGNESVFAFNRYYSSGEKAISSGNRSAALEMGNNGGFLKASTGVQTADAALATYNSYLEWGTASDYVLLKTGNAERVRVDNAGNVGIGTSPASLRRLHVLAPNIYSAKIAGVNPSTAVGSSAILEVENTDPTVGNTTGLAFRNSTGNSAAGIEAINVNQSISATGHLVFTTNNAGTYTEKMRIDSNGRVGIGVTPSSDFHLYRTGEDTDLTMESAGGTFANNLLLRNLGSDAGAAFNNIRSHGVSSHEHWYVGGDGVQNTLIVKTNGSERMRVDSAGQIGIGGTPTSLLHVISSTLATQQIQGGLSTVASQGARLIVTDGASAHSIGHASAIFGNSSPDLDIVAGNTKNLRLITANADRLMVGSDGRIFTHAIHNNANGAGGTTSLLASGTFTPTVACSTNCTSPSGLSGMYTRVGDVVTATLSANFSITAGGTETTVTIDLPVASNFASSSDGLGSGGTFQGGSPSSGIACTADSATDKMTCRFTVVTSTSIGTRISFQYVVK